MISLLQLVKFNSKKSQSHSVLLDFQQIHVRNAILFCMGLSMARILFGENIICQVNERGISQSFVDTKCFINGTMTIMGPVNKTTTIYHDYYQWVPVYLLLLAFGFYFPYSIWSKLVGNYLQHLESLADKPDDAIQVIKDSNGNWIYFKTWALETFYMIYLFIILYITDVFFNHIWSQSGWSWAAIYQIFPDNGTCFVFYYHSSGSTDGKFNCLLPLCSVYRKIFTFLYGLTLFLILFNIFVILYRMKTVVYKNAFVNVWWAFVIVKHSTVSWNAKEKLKAAYKSILDDSTEKLIPLEDMFTSHGCEEKIYQEKLV